MNPELVQSWFRNIFEPLGPGPSCVVSTTLSCYTLKDCADPEYGQRKQLNSVPMLTCEVRDAATDFQNSPIQHFLRLEWE